jgi:hypothetical protein
MTKRKSLSNKVRFEVFKRDKFTCQYCGKKAPDVVLEVDHIEPVSKGGKNEIINLITSCWTCNSGKSDIKLDDNTAIEKQRKQLEILEEKREQMKMMIEWKKGLENFNSEAIELIEDYWNSKIEGFYLNESGKKTLQGLYNKFEFDEILEAIDTAIEKYIKYDGISGEVTKESVEVAFSKIGGILHIKRMPPIKQKLSYIKGIARNRFGYFNPQVASIILNDYVKALEVQGYDESKILTDLEDEVIPKTIEAKNWSEWKSLIENWTTQVNSWQQKEDESQVESHFEVLEDPSKKEIDDYVSKVINQTLAIYSILEDIQGTINNEDVDRFKKNFHNSIQKYFSLIIENYETDWWLEEFPREYYSEIMSTLNYHSHITVDNWKAYFLDNIMYSLFKEFFVEISYIGDEFKYPKDIYSEIKDRISNSNELIVNT